MTLEEARLAYDEQVEVRYDGLIFDRISQYYRHPISFQ